MIPGTVTLKKQLDYESNHEVSFTVIATDSASPPSSVLTSTATVSVSLIDQTCQYLYMKLLDEFSHSCDNKHHFSPPVFYFVGILV